MSNYSNIYSYIIINIDMLLLYVKILSINDAWNSATIYNIGYIYIYKGCPLQIYINTDHVIGTVCISVISLISVIILAEMVAVQCFDKVHYCNSHY